MQKCPPTQNEEGFLQKCFKFFDIHNKGDVNFDQFYRTIEKIGVIVEKEVSLKLASNCCLYRNFTRSSSTTIKTGTG